MDSNSDSEISWGSPTFKRCAEIMKHWDEELRTIQIPNADTIDEDKKEKSKLSIAAEENKDIIDLTSPKDQIIDLTSISDEEPNEKLVEIVNEESDLQNVEPELEDFSTEITENIEAEDKQKEIFDIENQWDKATFMKSTNISCLSPPGVFDNSAIQSPKDSNINKSLIKKSILNDDEHEKHNESNKTFTEDQSEQKESNIKKAQDLTLSVEVDPKKDIFSNIEDEWNKITSEKGTRISFLPSPDFDDSVFSLMDNQTIRLSEGNQTLKNEEITSDETKTNASSDKSSRVELKDTSPNIENENIASEKQLFAPKINITDEEKELIKEQSSDSGTYDNKEVTEIKSTSNDGNGKSKEEIETLVSKSLDSITKALPSINCKDILHRQLSDIYSYKSNIPVYTPKRIPKKENLNPTCFKTPLKPSVSNMKKILTKTPKFNNVVSPLSLYINGSRKTTHQVASLSTSKGVLTPQNTKQRIAMPLTDKPILKPPKLINLKPSNTVVIRQETQKLPSNIKKLIPNTTVIKHQTKTEGYNRTKYFKKDETISHFDQSCFETTNDTSVVIEKPRFE